MSLKSELETKIPPPLLGFATALFMWLLAQVLPSLTMPSTNINKVGVVVIIVGICLDLLALSQFLRIRTSFDPTRPHKASTMVTSGLYRHSRNPMYLGLLIALLGWGLFLGNLASLACLFVFVPVITHFQVLPEERILREKFGKEYEEYAANVRRWV